MKEKIYEIPVNDAFDTQCECPICAMREKLEKAAIEYTMGPSYMEEDNRSETDKLGFCEKHIQDVCAINNRLGMAMVMKTHFDNVIDSVKRINAVPIKPKSIFKKNTNQVPIVSYMKKLNTTCFVCSRVDKVFDRYMDTILFLWKTDKKFREKYSKCNGFCNNHYADLLEEAYKRLKGDELDLFIKTTNELYISNMERVRDDLEWFINKFDYKYANEPWKNAKDAIPRALTKDNSIYKGEE